MEHLLNTLPILYVYWASVLIVWSVIICGMQGMLMIRNRALNRPYRRSDIIMMFTVGMCGSFLGFSIFAIPQITLLFVEIALMLALWYTVFLFALNHVNVLYFIHHH